MGGMKRRTDRGVGEEMGKKNVEVSEDTAAERGDRYVPGSATLQCLRQNQWSDPSPPAVSK